MVSTRSTRGGRGASRGGRSSRGGSRGDSRRSSRRQPRSTGSRNVRPPARSPYARMYVGAVVMALVAGAAFAYLVFRPKEGERQEAACAIVVDRTGSSINPLTRDSYLNLAQDAIDGCRDLKASLTVYYFDNQNAKLQQASDDQPYELFRPETQRQKLGEEKVAEAMDQALASVESVFAPPSAEDQQVVAHGSDIVTALSLASQSLQQQARVAGVDDTYLVVLTDGYQNESGLDMSATFTSPEASSDPLLDLTRTLGLVPQLAGTSVSFVGVGGGVASDQSQIPAWFETLVRGYWTSLVEAGGGQLCVYNVESTTLPGTC